VLVMVHGSEEEGQKSMEGLAAAATFVRHEVADRLHLRRAPELLFILDRSEKFNARVNDLLKRTKKT
jgi:ribosome-binding factor A